MPEPEKKNEKTVNLGIMIFIGTLLIGVILNIGGLLEEMQLIFSLDLTGTSAITLYLTIIFDLIYFGGIIYFQIITAKALYKFEPNAIRLAQLTLLLIFISSLYDYFINQTPGSARNAGYVLIWGSYLAFSGTVKNKYPKRKMYNKDLLAFGIIVVVLLAINPVIGMLSGNQEAVTYEKYEDCLGITNEDYCNQDSFNWCMQVLSEPDSEYCQMYVDCLKENKNDDYCTSQYFVFE